MEIMGIQTRLLTHDGEGNILPHDKIQFINFKWGDKNIADFDLVAIFNNDRLEKDAYASFSDNTTKISGLDGQIYWSSNYDALRLNFTLATDGITSEKLEEFKSYFIPGVARDLILSEHSCRKISARIASAPSLSILPFQSEKKVKGYKIKTNLYKGEISLSFVADFPFWKGKKLTGVSLAEMSESERQGVIEDKRPVEDFFNLEDNNLLPYALGEKGENIFNEIGYKQNTYLSDDGILTEKTGWSVTGFIPIKDGDIFVFENMEFLKPSKNEEENGNLNSNVLIYNSSFEKISSHSFLKVLEINSPWEVSYNSTTGDIASLTFEADVTSIPSEIKPTIAYCRFCCSVLDENSVIRKRIVSNTNDNIYFLDNNNYFNGSTIIENTEGCSLIGYQNKYFLYNCGTHYAYPIISFITNIEKDANGLIIHPATSYKKTGSTLQIGSQFLSYKLPNLLEEYNHALDICSKYTNINIGSLIDFKKEIKNSLKHPTIRDYILNKISSLSEENLDIDNIKKSVQDFLPENASIKYKFDSFNKTAEFNLVISDGTSITEKAEDSIYNDYLIIKDRTIFSNNFKIEENDLLPLITSHNLTNFKIEYQYLYK